ncbi:unnamed protein product [Heterobilharzia americana]|nr:unnamed protein product [Heterobilharzia americana]
MLDVEAVWSGRVLMIGQENQEILTTWQDIAMNSEKYDADTKQANPLAVTNNSKMNSSYVPLSDKYQNPEIGISGNDNVKKLGLDNQLKQITATDSVVPIGTKFFFPTLLSNGVSSTQSQRNSQLNFPCSHESSTKLMSREEALVTLSEKTSYPILQENGQRRYGPPPDWHGPQPPRGCEVFIGKIPRDCFEDELVPIFELVGKIYMFRLMMDFSGCNRGYGFCIYTNREDTKRAVAELDCYEIRKGKMLGVCFSVDNCRLFVGGIPKSKTKEEIMTEMLKVTEGVKDVIVYPSVADKTKNRGFAFVEYENHKAAAMARRKLIPGRIHLWGHQIAVDWAEPEREVDENIMSKVRILYVRNLMLHTSEDAVKDHFNRAIGAIDAVERVKKIRDYAFVHFRDRLQAATALQQLDGTVFDGSQIEVTWAKPADKNENLKMNRNTNSVLAPSHNYNDNSIFVTSNNSIIHSNDNNNNNLNFPLLANYLTDPLTVSTSIPMAGSAALPLLSSPASVTLSNSSYVISSSTSNIINSNQFNNNHNMFTQHLNYPNSFSLSPIINQSILSTNSYNQLNHSHRICPFIQSRNFESDKTDYQGHLNPLLDFSSPSTYSSESSSTGTSYTKLNASVGRMPSDCSAVNTMFKKNAHIVLTNNATLTNSALNKNNIDNANNTYISNILDKSPNKSSLIQGQIRLNELCTSISSLNSRQQQLQKCSNYLTLNPVDRLYRHGQPFSQNNLPMLKGNRMLNHHLKDSSFTKNTVSLTSLPSNKLNSNKKSIFHNHEITTPVNTDYFNLKDRCKMDPYKLLTDICLENGLESPKFTTLMQSCTDQITGKKVNLYIGQVYLPNVNRQFISNNPSFTIDKSLKLASESAIHWLLTRYFTNNNNLFTMHKFTNSNHQKHFVISYSTHDLIVPTTAGNDNKNTSIYSVPTVMYTNHIAASLASHQCNSCSSYCLPVTLNTMNQFTEQPGKYSSVNSIHFQTYLKSQPTFSTYLNNEFMQTTNTKNDNSNSICEHFKPCKNIMMNIHHSCDLDHAPTKIINNCTYKNDHDDISSEDSQLMKKANSKNTQVSNENDNPDLSSPTSLSFCRSTNSIQYTQPNNQETMRRNEFSKFTISSLSSNNKNFKKINEDKIAKNINNSFANHKIKTI